MPTGPSHRITTEILFDDQNNERARVSEPCRCTIGEDHDAYPMTVGLFEDDEDDECGERLNEWDAEDIFMSSGQDEDYDFR